MTIADRIRESREKLGVSQEDLAKKMGLKSRSSITRIEKSGDNVTMKDIERIAYCLDVSKLYLMGWKENDGTMYDIYKDKNLKRLINYYQKLTNKDKDNAINYIEFLANKPKEGDSDDE